jgi:hypothetical protein
LSSWGVISHSLLFHGRDGLVHVRGHARAPAKPHKLRVYDRGGVSYLLCARRSCIPCFDGGYAVACTTFYKRGFGVPS